MNQCMVCHNKYDRLMEIKLDGQVFYFDSFECAMHLLAPSCSHCSVRVVGHGVHVGEDIFCCAHCARSQGHVGLKDNMEKKTG